ncbi:MULTISPECIES: hypothetical protein [unclassified Providencia]|uniref:hypothetical protein n=1 Tax=unclassified Providencia TaxID=2633465 RepID=UPI00234B7151|nr:MULTISPECIES: hypothetical protein [unclassified Providencia]
MPKINKDDFRALRLHLTKRECANYNAAVHDFFQALKENELYEDDWIFPVIKNPEYMIPKINNLLRLIRHR